MYLIWFFLFLKEKDCLLIYHYSYFKLTMIQCFYTIKCIFFNYQRGGGGASDGAEQHYGGASPCPGADTGRTPHNFVRKCKYLRRTIND